MKTVNQFNTEFGQKIIDLLETTKGTKTPQGLGACIKQILDEMNKEWDREALRDYNDLNFEQGLINQQEHTARLQEINKAVIL